MRFYPLRTLIAISTALCLILLLGFLPISLSWALGLACLVLGLGAWAWLAVRRLQLRQYRITHSVLGELQKKLEEIPPALRRNQSVVLVLGNRLDSVFSSAIRQTKAGIWIKVEHAHQLPDYIAALAALRDGRSADAMMLALVPSAYSSKEVLFTQLQTWQQAIHKAGKAAGSSLPTILAVYAPLRADTPRDEVWYGWASGKQGVACARFVNQALLKTSLVRAAIDSASLPHERVQQSSVAQAVMDWAGEAVIPYLQAKQPGAKPVQINALCIADLLNSGGEGNLWGQYLLRRTALQMPVNLPAELRLCALPDSALAALPRRYRASSLWRGMGHLSLIVALFLSAAFAASVWHNKQLLAQIQQHLAYYQSLSPSQDAARKQAVLRLDQDRQQLQSYAKQGVPLRLGLGFYRGDLALPDLDKAIASYEPPKPPAPPPATIELDSMSLFDSGKALLKPGSNRYLLKAAGLINQHPDQRILVAGHTDSSGNAKLNEKLSLARAEAVREGLMDALSLPASQFAVQGYGASRPVVSNNTIEGRARNRRVEITLVPVVPAR